MTSLDQTVDTLQQSVPVAPLAPSAPSNNKSKSLTGLLQMLHEMKNALSATDQLLGMIGQESEAESSKPAVTDEDLIL